MNVTVLLILKKFFGTKLLGECSKEEKLCVLVNVFGVEGLKPA
jgi:hypothetical protein